LVEQWLEKVRADAAAHKAQRQALIEELQAWALAHAQGPDWKAVARQLHQFENRWRDAGHMSEKAFADVQNAWREAMKAARAPIDAVQQASVARRQGLIAEAEQLAAADVLRVDAVKALQQRWQVEAQSVPLDRKTEQKLWEVFRAPLDEAFQRKGTDRPQPSGPLSAHDRAVLEASKALDAANASGDATKIRAAMAALDAALRGQALQAQAAQSPVSTPTSSATALVSPQAVAQAQGDEVSAAASAATQAPADEQASDTATAQAAPAAPDSDSVLPVEPAPPVVTPKPVKPVVAVRGDDRPGQKRAEAPAGRDGRRDGRPGDRGTRPGVDRGPGAGRFGDRGAERGADRFGDRGPREDRGPRLGDAAFRAQREAMERAEMSLRKLAAQAHGETLGRVMTAWQARQAEALPTVQELGKGVNATARQAWAQAVSAEPKTPLATALLRLEMAADVPTPAEHLSDRRALQLQLLTQRNQPGPNETWAQDVAKVLSGPHDEPTARRLQNVLKNLLRT
jgi:hypothetical protein